MISRWHGLVVLMLLLLLPAGAVGQVSPPAVGSPTGGAGPVTSQAPAIPAAGVGDDYVIGHGDTIQVFVWRNPELTVTVPVRPDGKISTPLVEDMPATGKTPAQLARDIEARLAEYIRTPQVNVIVTTAQSFFGRVTVIGQVRNPGSYGYRQGMKVLDLVLAAGGLSEFAAGNRARLIRTEADGRRTEQKVRLKSLLEGGKLKENVDIRPGDTLIVPEALL